MEKWQKDLGKGFNRPIPKRSPQKDGHSKGPSRETIKVKYFRDDEKQVIDDTLLDEKASNLASKIKSLASSQMRKFYNEVKSLQMRLDTAVNQGKDRKEEFLKLRPLLKMLKSKVTYAQSRLGYKMPQAFVDFICSNIDSIKDVRDFEVFTLYFEAVVGYKGGK